MNSIIIYGPPASGKTTYARRLADMYDLTNIVDEWHPGQPLEDDTLYLTQIHPVRCPVSVRQISIYEARKDLALHSQIGD